MFECLKILLVFLIDIRNGQEVDGHGCIQNRSASSYACTGDIVSICSKTLLAEYVVSGFYHALIVYINIGYVNPCSYQIPFHGHICISDEA